MEIKWEINDHNFNFKVDDNQYLFLNDSDGKIRIQNPDGNKEIFVSDDQDQTRIQYNDDTSIILGVGSNQIKYTADSNEFITSQLLVRGPNYPGGILQINDNGVNGFASILGDIDGDGNGTKMSIDDSSERIYHKAVHHQYVGLQEFTDNADALLGGLEVGDTYYSVASGDGILKIVI